MARKIDRKGSLPPGWVVRTSKKRPDLIYYYNAITGDSTWDCPALDPPRMKSNSLGCSFDCSNDNNKRSYGLLYSSEDLDNSGPEKKFCPNKEREAFNYSENKSGNSFSIDNKNLNALINNANPVSSSIVSPKSVKKLNYNGTPEKTMATTAEFPNDFCQINRSDLDEFEDVEMLDVSQDLQHIDDLPTNSYSSYYIVIDTNVFVHNLKQIGVIHAHNMNGCGPPHIFIPWVVIQELDGLKRDARIKYAALDGVKYINKMIKGKHPRFHGQSPKEVRDWTQEYSCCNDDRILECCMSLADKIPPDKVILLTNDINLANKSIICDISAYDVKALMKKFNILIALPTPKKIVSTPVRKNLNAAVNTTVLSPDLVKQSFQSVVVKDDPVQLEVIQESSQHETMKYDSIQSANEEPENDTDKKIYNIMRKARFSLRKVLSAFMPSELDETVGCIWRTSKGDVSNLSGQLYLLTEYWSTTFARHFGEQDISKFEYLWTKLNCFGAFLYQADEGVTILTIIEEIFSVIKRKRPNMNVPIETLRNNRLKCMQLQFASKMHTISKNNAAILGTDIVLTVFEYNWVVINHLCGVVMDFYGIQHDFPYDKLSVMPTEAEFDRLMCDLYPSVLQLKKLMSKVVDRNPNTPPGQKFYKKFSYALKNLVPSLQVDVQPLDTSQFNATELENFCNRPENQEKISIGYQQLEHFFSKLQEALSSMASVKATAQR